MEYSIKPEKHELEAVRREIDQIIQKHSYSLEVENVRFNLGWQNFEKDCEVNITSQQTLQVVINPDKELENLEKNILRGVLEIEFMEKSGYEELRYNWQEIARMAYVKIRESNLTETELEVEKKLENKWPELKPKLGNETSQFDEDLYLHAGILADSIGYFYRQRDGLDKLPEARKSDIIKAGDDLFN
jgi:hypothetical protein